MATIFHLALAADWAAAQEAGVYTTSTRGRTLADQGFIHASRGDQWPRVRDRFYADVSEPMVLLQIDTERLDVPVVEEPGEPGGTETFPHIYGPLPVEAVVKAIALPARSGTPQTASAAPSDQRAAATRAPAAETEATAGSAVARTGVAGTPPTPPAASFAQLYFREMFLNAALVLLVVALGFLGLLVAAIPSGGDGLITSVGGLLGVLVGIVVATALYRRRQAQPVAPIDR